MKRFANGHSRLLSMLLSLVLLVGLVPAISLPAYAESENINNISISNANFHYDGSLASISISYNVVNAEKEGIPQGAAYGKFVVHSGISTNQYHWLNPYGTGAQLVTQENMSDTVTWPTLNATVDPTIVAVDGGTFRWTYEKGGSKTHIAHFGVGTVKPNTEYYLYMWSLTKNTNNNIGAYPDTFFAKIRLVGEELQVLYNMNDTFGPLPHAWDPNPVTTGNGTKEAVTTLTCSCGTQVRVSLTASDVTLPGDAFNAEITVEETQKEGAAAYGLRAARSVAPAGHGLKISDTPGYKYSPDGTNFTDIDPNTSPKAGFYQASILVKDANDTTLENLYVNYTVTDPAVTAATGDNRPIEIVVMGMALFSALAVAAFVLDSRRRGSR